MYKNDSIIIDIDGTLCPLKKKKMNYEDLIPSKEIIEKIIEYKNNGFIIVLFTSRNMRTYDGNIGLINKNTAVQLNKWLNQWNVPYDQIIYGKPWPGDFGFYVDDRTVRPKEFLEKTADDLRKLMAADSTK